MCADGGFPVTHRAEATLTAAPTLPPMPTTLVLFDRDLRVRDHAPLYHAAARGAVVPVLIWSPEDEGDWPMGAAQRAWLAQSLPRFDAALRARDSRLTVRTGPTLDALAALLDETGADALYWHRRFTPAGRALDAALLDVARERSIEAEAFDGRILHDPDALRTGAGDPYKVYTPFGRALVARTEIPPPLPEPAALAAPLSWPASELDALVDALTPSPRWDAGFWDVWTPGEDGALERLDAFVRVDGNATGLDRYDDERNRPDRDGSSRLSPYLALGEVSIRTVWHAAQGSSSGRTKFRNELAWREFAYHLLWHFPHTTDEPLKSAFARIPWRDAPDDFAAWSRGRTGFPYLDAALRQLWTTGWMHNRTRMAVGGFLVKHLLLPWQAGARWFWDTLVDADLANNTLGWQWVTGSGADAAPYFRVLSPMLQGEKFDPQAKYTQTFVPELSGLVPQYALAPWDAPPDALRRADVVLGQTYPHRIVDAAAARQRALDAYARTKTD